MKEQFVTIEIAKRLRELGFNEECFTYWEDKYTGIEGIPLWQQAIDWFRNKFRMIIEVLQEEESGHYSWEYLIYYDLNTDKPLLYYQNIYEFESYEIAREQAILKALELIK